MWYDACARRRWDAAVRLLYTLLSVPFFALTLMGIGVLVVLAQLLLFVVEKAAAQASRRRDAGAAGLAGDSELSFLLDQ